MLIVAMVALEEFLAAPSERLLVKLTKEQLLQVADHYAIELPSLHKSAKKEQLVDYIREFLIEKQILSGVTSINPPPESQVNVIAGMPESNINVQSVKSSDLSFEQQKQLWKMQMEWEQKKLAMEQQMLERKLEQEIEQKRLEAVEKEKDRVLELEKLRNQEQQRDLERIRLRLLEEGKSDRNRPTSKPSLAGMVKFLPKFNERDPDIFFSLFENVASDQHWDDDDKTILLQTVLVGRAQEAFVALTSADRKSYDAVKQAVLKCYELVPEAYRQRFRNWRKSEKQTHAEVAREFIQPVADL